MGRVARVGFVGVGWIDNQRIEAACADGALQVAAVADPSPAALADAFVAAPLARTYRSLDAMLAAEPLDGVVLATPSAAHAEQAMTALRSGVAVFCQQPLARTAVEAAAVIDTARRADRLLGVDRPFRHVNAVRRVRQLVHEGGLGDVFAARLVFHDAYGPDKRWSYDAALSGGGCVIDLGTQLFDLALWVLGWPDVDALTSRCWTGGRPLGDPAGKIEDYAVARLDVAGGATVELACSWRLHVGSDAEIEASFWGTQGGAAIRNAGGSFYDFRAERFDGSRRETLVEPPGTAEGWSGGALIAWARQLQKSPRFDPEAAHVVEVASLVDRVYRRWGFDEAEAEAALHAAAMPARELRIHG